VNQWRAGAAVFGKASWHPEFLRASRPSADLHLFDEWLFRNASALTSREAAAPGQTASCGFLLQMGRAADPRCGVAGVLEPSHDRAGRSYPLAVAASIVFGLDLDARPEVVPIVLEAYWDSALDVLTAIRSGPSTPDDRSLDDLTAASVDVGTGAYELYADWTQATDERTLCELLDRPPRWLERAALTIVDAIAARRRNAGPRGLEAIRVPLGSGAGGALCFWLDVLRRAAHWQAHVPSFFWSYDGHSGEALLFLDRATDGALSALWRVTEGDVCDLTAPAEETDDVSVDSKWADGAPIGEPDRALSALLDWVDARSAALV
jgi:type VI secretion system ImpM family protein